MDGVVIKGGTSGSVGEDFVPALPEPSYPWPTAPLRPQIDPNVKGDEPISHGG